MNSFEKLAMILVPLIGLTGILFFFQNYNLSLQKADIASSELTYATKQTVSHKPKSKPTKTRKYTQSTNKQQYYQSFIQSETERKVIISQKKPTRRAIQENTYESAESIFQRDQERQRLQKQRYQARIKANKLRIQKRKNYAQIRQNHQDSNCAYYLKNKEKIREIMRRGYKTSQYNHLEDQRKYWRDKYAQNCF